MATSVWSTVLDHSTTAGFNAWATELIVKLLAVNAGQLTQTADTGQLANPVVAARPAVNTAAGYWIFKWTDGVSTDLYFKIEVGTCTGVATGPQIWITVGTGSNGSGTLTGAQTVRSAACQNSAPLSTTTNYTSYLCVATGSFALGWKTLARGTAPGMGFFATLRSIDDSGVVNNDGYANYTTPASAAWLYQAVNLSNSVVFNGNTLQNVCIVPYLITTSVVGGNAQYFRNFAAYPLGRPLGHIVCVIPTEFAVGTSFAGESGSITDHTFLSLGTAVTQSNYSFAILWQ